MSSPTSPSAPSRAGHADEGASTERRTGSSVPSGLDGPALYGHALRARLLSARMVGLQHEGRVAFHSACIGEEVAIVAAALALRDKDWFFPGHREWAGALVRGIPTRTYAHQAFGSAADAVKGHGSPDHPASKAFRVVPASGMVGAHLVQAVGAAWAAKMRKDDVVTLAMFGTAAAATGDFHNAINFAGVFKAPCVLVSRDSRDAAATRVSLADRAAAYGVACASIDGSDAAGVLALLREAVARAAAGDGPTLVEIATRRFTELPDHSPDGSALLALGPEDPLARLRAALEKDGSLDGSAHEALVRDTRAEIESAIAEAEGAARPAFATIFEDVYAEVPAHLRAQAQEASK